MGFVLRWVALVAFGILGCAGQAAAGTYPSGGAGVSVLCSAADYHCAGGGYSGSEPWGYYTAWGSTDVAGRLHNCTSYAAFRLALNGVARPGWHGNANAWDELARAASLTEADVAAITARLARMDKSSGRGPWTGAVLGLIAAWPGIVSTVLAEAMGWERQDFKLHVRRLKELGLTLSLDVGYRLSPRGESYLNHLRTR